MTGYAGAENTRLLGDGRTCYPGKIFKVKLFKLLEMQ